MQPHPSQQSRLATGALTTLPALAGFALSLLATRHGVGVTPDSVTYIDAARNLVLGNGLHVLSWNGSSVPLTHHPPLYPAALAAPAALGLDIPVAARWLNAVLFAASLLVVARIGQRLTGRALLALLGCVVALSSTALLRVQAMAWSESLFALFTLLGLYWLSLYVAHGKMLYLWASSGAAALACLTRYPGIALVLTGAVAILWLAQAKPRNRMGTTFAYLAVACGPLAAWVARNLAVAGSAAERPLAFHPVTLGKLGSALNTVSLWLLPARLPTALRFAVLLAFLAGAALAAVMVASRDGRAAAHMRQQLLAFLKVTCVFVAIYSIVLVLSISLLDADTPLDERILSPLFAPTLISTLALAAALTHITASRALKLALALAAISLVALYTRRATAWVSLAYSEGLGYASLEWRHSPSMASIRRLPISAPIYTNGPRAIYYLTGRPAAMIPWKVDLVADRENTHYADELAKLRDRLAPDSAVIVYFNRLADRWWLPTEEELGEALPLVPLRRCSDGTIYRMRSGAGRRRAAVSSYVQTIG